MTYPQLGRRSKGLPKRRFDPFDLDLLRYLKSVKNPKTTSHMAEKTDMAWVTAREHLEDLFNRGYVKRRILPNKILWKIKRVNS